MFKFDKEQKIMTIGDVDIGGQPGRSRTMMAGSVFYPGHSIVLDRLKGLIDPGKYRDRMDRFLTAGEEASTPIAVMAYAETEESMRSYLSVLMEDEGFPIFLDSPDYRVKLAGARMAEENGILDRVVYNSLGVGTTREEWDGVRDIGLRNAVLMAFSPKDLDVKGKIYLLNDGGSMMSKGLIDLARDNGVDRPLIDTAAMSMEQGAGAALRAILVAKARWGLPCGCALHNTVESWDVLGRTREESPELFRYVDVASASIPIMSGADFVMFGPIEYGRRAMMISAFTDMLLRQSTADLW